MGFSRKTRNQNQKKHFLIKRHQEIQQQHTRRHNESNQPNDNEPNGYGPVRPPAQSGYAAAALIHGQGTRKNATRESTQQLKMWLNEHQKNPYPTKAEKVMLAILSGMTLTQVSTWFANARRRLKKENKWSPDGS